MRTLIVTEFMTLDAESLLLGRVTYEGFSAAWPERHPARG